MSMQIEIVEPSDGWTQEFVELATPLRSALGALALRIDHIGSTSVSGLPAKDIIDIQVTVRELNREALSSRLATIGYTRRADIDRDHVPPGTDPDPTHWQKLYFRAPDGQRATHLHVRQAGRLNQRYPILFRDYLRSHPAATGAYAQVKFALARLHPTDVEAYYDVKDPVCDLIMQAAGQWADAVDWQPGDSDG